MAWLAAAGAAAVGAGCVPAGSPEEALDEASPEQYEGGEVVPEAEPVPKAAGGPATACRCDSDCLEVDGHEGICVFGICMTRASSACAFAGSSGECPAGSRCWGLRDWEGSICWPDCASYPGCVGTCDADGSCFLTSETSALCAASCASYCRAEATPPAATGGSIGSECDGDAECDVGTCYESSSTGWIDGYCMWFGCASAGAPCGEGGICVERLSTDGRNICMRACGDSSDCRSGYACRPVYGQDVCWPGEACSPSSPDGWCPSGRSCVDGACEHDCSPSHPEGHCEGGLVCDGGVCSASVGCGSWECSGSWCDDIVLMPGPTSPTSAAARAAGYYLAHGTEYSYLRRDLTMLVEWAACMMTSRFPGIAPLALLDMTEADGTTPGCPEDCRHPSGTHTGSDIDTAYFQTDGDNDGQCICGDGTARCWNGYADAFSDGYRCTTEENIVDLEQQVWFLAYMAHSPDFRVVGVDDTLCDDIPVQAAALRDAGEIDDTIYSRITHLGCYSSHSSWAFHHHHLHFSYY